MWDLLRLLFARLGTAPAGLRLTRGLLSFNTAGGRCEACEGAGVVEVGMRYLGAVQQTCGACGGRVVVEGPPAAVAACAGSHTGLALSRGMAPPGHDDADL